MANNTDMRFNKSFNRLQCVILIAYIISSLFLALGEIMTLASTHLNEQFEVLFVKTSSLLNLFIPFIFCFFIVFSLTSNQRHLKALWSVLFLAVINTCFGVICDNSVIIATGFVYGLLCVFCFNRFDLFLSLSLTALIAVLYGVLFGYLYEFWDNFSMSLCELISGKKILSSALFAVANSILDLFGDKTIADLFFYNSFGGSLFFEGEIITGVKDLFASGYSGTLVSSYLSGHIFQIFIVIGASIVMLEELKGVQKYVFLTVAFCSIISGNYFLFAIFVFLESISLFVSYIILTAICYCTSYLLDIDIGYLYGGGIIELALYANNYVYLFTGGVVLLALAYFVYKYCVQRFSISDCENIYIPTKLLPLVNALGGIGNIIRIKDNALEVRNPNLINTLAVKCEIKENIICINEDKINMLKEYLDCS